MDDIWGLGTDLEEIAPKFRKDADSIQPIYCHLSKVAHLDVNHYLGTMVDSSSQSSDKNVAYGWGRNDYFQISSKKKPFLDFKKKLDFSLPLNPTRKTATGTSYSIRDRSNSSGSVNSSEEDSRKQGVVSQVVSSQGGHVTYVLTTSGLLFITGNRQNATFIERLPGDLENSAIFVKFPFKVQVTGVVPGKHHALAWDTEGHTFGWGLNKFGCLGLEKNHLRSSQVISRIEIVESVRGAKVVECFIVGHASFAVTYQGKIFQWGK